MIEKGDKVTVTWNLEGGEETLTGIVMHVPSDVGDMWYIKDEYGFKIAINPSNYRLESIRKEQAG